MTTVTDPRPAGAPPKPEPSPPEPPDVSSLTESCPRCEATLPASRLRRAVYRPGGAGPWYAIVSLSCDKCLHFAAQKFRLVAGRWVADAAAPDPDPESAGVLGLAAPAAAAVDPGPPAPDVPAQGVAVCVARAADDLGDFVVRVEGDLRAAFYVGQLDDDLDGSLLAFSDGSILKVACYDDVWRITPLAHGSATYRKTAEAPATDPGGSDRVALAGYVAWVVCGQEIVRRGKTQPNPRSQPCQP